jgi:dUTP pyrophosphatase
MNKIYFETEAVMTKKEYRNDAGYDLKCKKEITINPREVAVIETGAYVELLDGFYGKIEGRSSLNMQGIISVGGVIDVGYRGEIKVGLINTTQEPYTLEAFSKIAQIIIIPCDVNAKIVIGKPENNTLRGSNGFGSTGK